MVIQDIGIAPFDFKFDAQEMHLQDSHLVGGAFTGIQSIINEITSTNLNSFETGENRILITRYPFPTFDSEVQVLLWSTEDDKYLRSQSEKLAKFIATTLEYNFMNSTFDETFNNVIASKIKELFDNYL